MENKKKYVGKTQVALPTRLSQHRSDARRGVETYLCNAIRKYGWGYFEVEVLSLSSDPDVEREWIARLGTFNRKRGYNLTSGGEGSPGAKSNKRGKHREDLSAEVRAKIAKKVSESLIGNKRRLGIPHDEETIKKMMGRVPHNKHPQCVVDEIMRLDGLGLSQQMIADDLGISQPSVSEIIRRHSSSLFKQNAAKPLRGQWRKAKLGQLRGSGQTPSPHGG